LGGDLGFDLGSSRAKLYLAGSGGSVLHVTLSEKVSEIAGRIALNISA
jgi:hypothetical protein